MDTKDYWNFFYRFCFTSRGFYTGIDCLFHPDLIMEMVVDRRHHISDSYNGLPDRERPLGGDHLYPFVFHQLTFPAELGL